MTNLQIIKYIFVVLILSTRNISCSKSTKGTEISLDKEIVEISIVKISGSKKPRYKAKVSVFFYMGNTRGFSGKLAFPGTRWFTYENFRVKWNDINLKTSIERAPKDSFFEINGNRYYHILVYSAPKTTKNESVHIVTYEYTLPYVNFQKDYEKKGYYLEYILKTGALWKGKVQSLTAVLKTDKSLPCKRIFHFQDSYRGRCVKKNTWTFNADNINLNRDIRLLFLMP